MDLSNSNVIIRDLRSMQRQTPKKENNRLFAYFVIDGSSMTFYLFWST